MPMLNISYSAIMSLSFHHLKLPNSWSKNSSPPNYYLPTQ